MSIVPSPLIRAMWFRVVSAVAPTFVRNKSYEPEQVLVVTLSDYVTPADVSRMAAPVLRHRLVLTPEAELEPYGPDDAVRTALGDVPVPR